MNKVKENFVYKCRKNIIYSGFEYCVNQTLGGWCPTEKVFHLNRRRRWYRTRIIKEKTLDEKKVIIFICFLFNFIIIKYLLREIYFYLNHMMRIHHYFTHPKWVLDIP